MDVALVQWPSDEALRRQLAAQRQPRLLLVEPEAGPPECTDLLEDWVRLPVSRDDRNARIRLLESRARHETGARPALSDEGTLEFGGSAIDLSPLQADLVRPLVDRFGAVVLRDTLVESAWPGPVVRANNLDVTVGRLRRRVGEIGLQVSTVRSRGYVLVASSKPR